MAVREAGEACLRGLRGARFQFLVLGKDMKHSVDHVTDSEGSTRCVAPSSTASNVMICGSTEAGFELTASHQQPQPQREQHKCHETDIEAWPHRRFWELWGEELDGLNKRRRGVFFVQLEAVRVPDLKRPRLAVSAGNDVPNHRHRVFCSRGGVRPRLH